MKLMFIENWDTFMTCPQRRGWFEKKKGVRNDSKIKGQLIFLAYLYVFWNLFYDIYLFVYASKYPESSKFRGSTAVLRSIL